MAITVFDGVGKFTADTSQLDQFIVKLEQGLTGASDKAAASTRALKTAQDEFRASIKAVSVEGGDTAANMSRLADAEKQLSLASAAAKQEHASLRAELTQSSQSAGAMSQVTKELTGQLVGMLGVIGSIQGFKALIEGTQRSVLNLELLSEKTGIAIETLAGIQHVSEAAGVSFDDVSTALSKLSKNQALAAEGSKAQEDGFKRIGISVAQLKTLSPEQLFYRVADAMANAKNHAEANASAFALLGRGGAALIPIFQQDSQELKKMVDEAAQASGITKEAADAAREWQAQVANLTEALRSGLIPVMEVIPTILRAIEGLGADTAMVARDLGAAIGGIALAIYENFSGIAKQMDDVVHGRFRQMVADGKQTADDVTSSLKGIADRFKDSWQTDAASIKQIWSSVKPLKPATDDLSDLGKSADDSLKKYQAAILDAQTSVGNAVIELLKQQALQRVEVEEQGYSLEKAATKADFSEQLDALAQLELQKRAIEAKAAEDSYQLQLKVLEQKLAAAQAEGSKTIALQTSLSAQIEALQFKHQATLIQTWTKAMDSLRQTMSQPIPLITETPPGLDTISNDVTQAFDKAEEAAQGLGITLRSDLNENLQKAYDAYAKLTDLLKTGAVTEADAKNGYIALVKAELDFAQQTNASTESIKKLKQQLKDLGVEEGKQKNNLKDFTAQLRRDMQDGASAWVLFGDTAAIVSQGIVGSIADGFAALVTGQESFGQAMGQAVAKMIAQMAQQWAEYFAALAIADLFFDPPRGAAELAAAIALEALSGTLAGVASGSGSHSSSTSATKSVPNGPAGSATPQPTGGLNTPHVGSGGIISERTLALLGDDSSGSGNAAEAVLPLTNRRAMEMIAAAILPGFEKIVTPGLLSSGTLRVAASNIAPGSRSSTVAGASAAAKTTGAVYIHNDMKIDGVISDDNLGKVMEKMSQRVNTGKSKLLASNSIRLTRRS